ncbi:4-amino-4-deoxy-L-arabinose transferase [Nocardioides stalactiti]|uniref:4-amino-4-deoxy-L-arabinose transferase n=1 Tax=Nocardioides stalactiti TaxID=2755356 RepID=UPI001FEADB94|nr:4-amino-4-deoxy-L-arabinose transferase [Nocardioides stalactiti]
MDSRSESPGGRPAGALEDTARLVLALAAERPPTLGATRLVSVDGPAGSGKSTLASALAALDEGAHVVHMDDLYDGWGGLGSISRQLSTLVRPLALGRAGFYRRYDWHRGEFAETVDVEPPPLLVLEGVGAGAAELTTMITVLVWVSAPRELRRQRGLARDGEALAPQWDGWMRQEDEHFATQRTAERADVLVDGTGARSAERMDRELPRDRRPERH